MLWQSLSLPILLLATVVVLVRPFDVVCELRVDIAVLCLPAFDVKFHSHLLHLVKAYQWQTALDKMKSEPLVAMQLFKGVSNHLLKEAHVGRRFVDDANVVRLQLAEEAQLQYAKIAVRSILYSTALQTNKLFTTTFVAVIDYFICAQSKRIGRK